LALALATSAVGCTARTPESGGTGGAPATIAAGAGEVQARLAASPRHGEWAMVRMPSGDSLRAWVVYPERRDRAPVVVVVHEIFGLTNWVRGVADQLAADGFVAIAPDLLSGKGVPTGPDGDPVRDSATAAIRTLDPATVQLRLAATARHAMALPAALPRYGIVGFCWGGSASFAHAAYAPGLGAAVVYYGTSPPAAALATVRAPVLGLYGENDARVNATIAPADSALRALGRTYQHQLFAGAGHGFLRQQDGQNGANLLAAQAAWPLTVQWFRRHLRG
ncbi:MAG TPA: dienelactone hydrolase family protein, partial [Longimicrobium sp.]